MVRPVDYKQYDPKWAKVSYAVDGETSTIKSAGCGPTALANVLAAIVSPYIDPVTCAAWARQHGFKYYKQGTAYSYPVAQGKAYGVTIRQLTTRNVYGKPNDIVHTVARNELENGNWLIACMGKGLWTSQGHFITVYGAEGDKVYINDPSSARADRACNKWDLFKSQVKMYWVVEVPKTVKEIGITDDGEYLQEDFVRECQLILKAGIDGKAGSQTLNKTITVSNKKNRTHPVVLPLQKKLKKLGMYTSGLDCIAGNNFKLAVDRYQASVLGYGKLDGEITAKGKMWKSLLGIK